MSNLSLTCEQIIGATDFAFDSYQYEFNRCYVPLWKRFCAIMSLEGSGMVAAKKNCAAKLCRSLPLMAMLWQSTLPAGRSLPVLCQKILGIKELAKSLPESFLFWDSLPEVCHYLWIWWLLEVISFHLVVYLEFQNLLDKDNYTLSSRPPQYW